ncbi:ribonuclease HI family protein [Patescibacteria group bacterium]|nr:MAG: ribonuclease HI family protein [Patescibacteria group bacterium]
MKYEKLAVFTDGGARGNPGPAGLGVVLKHNDKTIASFGEYLGETTNNQAEYLALAAALEAARSHGAKEVDCFLDSELVVKQMRGEYRVKNPGLAPLFLKIWNLTQQFSRVRFHHIPREKNKEADAQVNAAIDRAGR